MFSCSNFQTNLLKQSKSRIMKTKDLVKEEALSSCKIYFLRQALTSYSPIVSSIENVKSVSIFLK